MIDADYCPMCEDQTVFSQTCHRCGRSFGVGHSLIREKSVKMTMARQSRSDLPKYKEILPNSFAYTLRERYGGRPRCGLKIRRRVNGPL